MFERVAAVITDKLESSEIIQPSNKEVCAYGLRQIFSTILNAGTMLLIGILMHMTIEAIVFTISYIPLRIYAGGYHASTPQRCWAISAMMLFISLFTVKIIPEDGFWYVSVSSLFACVLIFLLSPVEDINKPLDEKEHQVYRFRTMIVMLLEILIAVLMYVLQFKYTVMLFELVWCSIAIMLILGKFKIKRSKEKGGFECTKH